MKRSSIGLIGRIAPYVSTGRLCATQTFDGGVLNVIGSWALRLVTLLVMLAVWSSLLREGAGTGGLSLPQVLTYAVLSSILSEQLNIVSPASLAFWEGTLASRYTRPMSVILQLMAETVGRWIPHILFYSIPTLLLVPLLGVDMRPAGWQAGLLFIPGLLMAISLGFAMDLLFAALTIHIKNAGWMALAIRNAFLTLFSGALIPFGLLPWGLGNIFRLLPFGSLASAPLTLYAAMADPLPTLLLQLMWNLLLWPVALAVFRHSEERMVAYGG
jgi:ABC-2 type transport system permease protein